MAHRTLVKPGSKVSLKDIDPGGTGGWDEEAGKKRRDELGKRLTELQELMFAAGQTPLLVVLQGRDTAGKDGSIRHLLNFFNAQSTRVSSFKVPTPKELGHDYLWRVHSETPGKGETVIFNRSHYEDVLVVRVHELVPESVWGKRYGHINDFERLLTDCGTRVVKFCLHISKDEQEERLREREQDTAKAWKLSVGDWKERELWDDYTKAYEDALSHCSTENAPWHIVPANHKWHRDLMISEVLVETLEEMADGWMKKLEEIGTKAKAELAEYRALPRG